MLEILIGNAIYTKYRFFEYLYQQAISATNRSKSLYVREALERSTEQIEGIYLAYLHMSVCYQNANANSKN